MHQIGKILVGYPTFDLCLLLRLEDVGFTRQQEPRIATVTFDETMLVDMPPLLATDGADSDTTASDGNGGGDDAGSDFGAGMY